MSEAQTHIAWALLAHDSETVDDGHGNKIVALTLLLRAGGKDFAVCVSGPAPLPLKDAINALRAAQGHTFSIFGIDPSSIMKDMRIAQPGETRGDAPLNG